MSFQYDFFDDCAFENEFSMCVDEQEETVPDAVEECPSPFFEKSNQSERVLNRSWVFTLHPSSQNELDNAVTSVSNYSQKAYMIYNKMSGVVSGYLQGVNLVTEHILRSSLNADDWTFRQSAGGCTNNKNALEQVVRANPITCSVILSKGYDPKPRRQIFHKTIKNSYSREVVYNKFI